MCLQDLQRLGFCLARMDNYRQTSFTGQPQLSSKNSGLYITRGVIVMKVQSYFSPSHNLAMTSQLNQPFQVLVGRQYSFMGMNPDRCIEILELFGQSDCVLWKYQGRCLNQLPGLDRLERRVPGE